MFTFMLHLLLCHLCANKQKERRVSSPSPLHSLFDFAHEALNIARLEIGDEPVLSTRTVTRKENVVDMELGSSEMVTHR